MMYDTVVLGLGGVGSFALRAVARDCYDDVQEKGIIVTMTTTREQIKEKEKFVLVLNVFNVVISKVHLMAKVAFIVVHILNIPTMYHGSIFR